MPRTQRIQYENAIYHVMNRGSDRQPIFFGNSENDIFSKTMSELPTQFGVKVFAFCLMTNHYHLLLQTPKANLARTMRHFGHCYTQRFNLLHGRDGPLFRGRYRALIVQDENYFVQVARYIHRNPVEARIVPTAGAFKFSSFRYYLGSAQKPKWLETDFLLSLYSPEKHLAKKRLAEYTNQSNSPSLEAFYNQNRLPTVLESETVIRHFDVAWEKWGANLALNSPDP